MKDSLDKQIQERDFYKENAFRMGKDVKNLNRPDLQVKFYHNTLELEGK